MKAKTIFTLAVAGLITAGISSCEDMLRVDSKTYDYGHDMTAQDTVYSVMGIIQKLQTIADRTVLLGAPILPNSTILILQNSVPITSTTGLLIITL